MAVNRGRTPNVKLNYINYDAVGWNTAEDENWSLLDSMISQFIKINGIVGTWKNSTLYNNGDVVVDIDTGVLWVCQLTGVSPATGSFTDARALLTNQWLQKSTLDAQAISTTVRPEDYGAVAYEEEPASDSTGSVVQAIAHAILVGIPLQLAKTYRLTSTSVFTLGPTDKLTINGNGGFFCDAGLAGNPFIDINVDASSVVAITAVDNTITHDFAGQGNLSDCAKLTFAAGHGLTAGMVGRVISDDALTDGTGVEYTGEAVYIGEIDANGTDIYLAARLRNTYTTSPRIVIYAEGARLQVSDITISGDAEKNALDARKWVGIRVTGMVNPVFERVKGVDTSNAVLQTNGCIHSLFLNNQFARGYNNVSVSGITGYGIRDINPEYSLVVGNRGHDVRSVYKADTTTSTPANPFSYGAPHGGIVSENQGINCSGVALDTGRVGVSYQFANNRTNNPYQGNNITYAGIQAWGKRHTVHSHRHTGSGAGIIVGTNAPGEDARHVIRDLYYNGSYVGVWSKPSVSGTIFDMEDSEIITTYTYGAVALSGCTMYGRDNRYALRGSTTTRRFYSLEGSAIVEEIQPLYDASQVVTAATWLIGYKGDALNKITIERGRVKAIANAWTAVVYEDINSVLGVTKFQYDLTTDLAPTDTDGIDSAVAAVSGAFDNIYPAIRVDGANGYSSAYKSSTPSLVSHAFSASVNNCPAELVVRSYVNTDSAGFVGSISAGLFKGQRLTIVNDPNSTQNFSVKTTTTNVAIVADTAIAPKSALGFTWNGTLWVCTSIGVSVSGTIGVTTHHALTGWDDFDDHAQYLNNARFDTRFGAQNIAALNDVPAIGSTGQTLRVAAGVLAYKNPVADLPARDAAYVGPSTHVADTAGLVDASVSIYPIATVTKVALRLFASTAKAIWCQLTDHAFAILVDWKESSTGEPELRIRSAAAAAVKTYIGSAFSIFGGDSGARVGTETVGFVGDIYVSGNVNGPVQDGTYANPYLVGSVRFWDDGTGLRQKRGSDPANATDGTAL